MNYIGIDIGSTSAKYVVQDNNDLIIHKNVLPTGWSSIDTAQKIKDELEQSGCFEDGFSCVATGYGRISVDFADKIVTEITCHGKGAAYLFDTARATVIDIGGQDTKIISIEDDMIQDFIMNDKCSAGTGRFLEIMANTLGLTLEDMCELAKQGKEVIISSMCTVFAESEVISLIGNGTPKADIAYGIIDSIISKVYSQCGQYRENKNFYLTGGLCDCGYIVSSLGNKLGHEVKTCPLARYAGAIGASILAKELKGTDDNDR